ncbi:cell wall metabolism sensor histidine kinase WalK [Paenibacillus sp. CF384]|uniref:sensor histidine kinase n=1 Tax=Paenibacillus sp. CF384 TaxID=1884382 RepID=UPI00089B1492|nr:HAMP domain-containing sensor histidine kinase [Paenibacillus sp. CF384]SDX14316.1 Signal transduction histidine kinase [Paenibacillus sp. CF384]
MIKSLYVRTVLVFVGVVIASLIFAFFLATRLYSTNIKELGEEQLIESGKRIIMMIQKAPEAQSAASLDEVTSNIVLIPVFKVKIVDEHGIAVKYGNVSDLGAQFHVTTEQYEHVIRGGIFRGTVAAFPGDRHGPETALIGLPFEFRDHPYALFVSPELNDLLDVFRRVMLTVLFSVLAMGSLLILLASRFIVKPLQRLTRATKRMAQGDFGIKLQTKRKDEIGVLTASFNEMAKSLRMLDQMRSDFVNNVAHEFQSPLTSITGFSKALRTKPMDESGRQHYLMIIEEESQRLARLSANLLRLSVLQQDQGPVHPTSYRLDEQIRRIIIASEPQWSVRGIEFELELEDLTIQGDEDSLDQVWHNLISNSIKFSQDKGCIGIRLQQVGEMAVITVRDHGIGIPQEEQQHIFTSFYKVDKSRDYAVKGNGLGLSIVKRIVDLHHGEIAVTSLPGVETVFTVWLPLEVGGISRKL